jgi:hypothetical protein
LIDDRNSTVAYFGCRAAATRRGNAGSQGWEQEH